MSDRIVIWVFISIGGTVGAFVPALFGAGWLSLWSIVTSTIGSLAGIWVGYRLIHA